ncbi:hypothetical protein GCM10022252_16950 [Streptosporangium oxazolinicum]|uniref:Uncharacterized protein n=1 Tax=Streptosporangium oxazolinicum TaxID=909287 RepID=A0ABP8AL89_9ACTN
MGSRAEHRIQSVGDRRAAQRQQNRTGRLDGHGEAGHQRDPPAHGDQGECRRALADAVPHVRSEAHHHACGPHHVRVRVAVHTDDPRLSGQVGELDRVPRGEDMVQRQGGVERVGEQVDPGVTDIGADRAVPVLAGDDDVEVAHLKIGEAAGWLGLAHQDVHPRIGTAQLAQGRGDHIPDRRGESSDQDAADLPLLVRHQVGMRVLDVPGDHLCVFEQQLSLVGDSYATSITNGQRNTKLAGEFGDLLGNR